MEYKFKGRPTDRLDVRISKSLSWVLRHGANHENLKLRPDGYARVTDILALPKFRNITLPMLQDIVKEDQKQRYHLLYEPVPDASSGSQAWWIRANQGHSMKNIAIEMEPVISAAMIPMAVHGTTRKAWESISKEGLSKMKRHHIHLARGIAGDNVVSGMRQSSAILIFIDVQKAIDAGIKFYLSANGVVLTAGDEHGYLEPRFFERVEIAKTRQPAPGWEVQSLGKQPVVNKIQDLTIDVENTERSGEVGDQQPAAPQS